MIIFVDGPDKAGKDYFLKFLSSRIPINIFYAGGHNFFSYSDSVKKVAYDITYRTILDSISKQQYKEVNFVYRSPFTDYVYNELFNRHNLKKPLDSYFDLLSDYDDYVRKDSEFLFILPSIEELLSRFNSEQDQYLDSVPDYETLIKLYTQVHEQLKQRGYNSLILSNPIQTYFNIQKFVYDKLRQISEFVFYDIDNTVKKPNKNLIYLTGRTESDLGEFSSCTVIYNPYNTLPLFKSSRLFKIIAFDTIISSDLDYKSLTFYDDRKDILNLYISYLLKHNLNFSLDVEYLNKLSNTIVNGVYKFKIEF